MKERRTLVAATWRVAISLACALAAAAYGAVTARAQDDTAAPSTTVDEEIEPRVVGRRGLTTIGFAGYLDRFFSPEEVLTGHYTVQVDGAHFLTGRIAVRGGVAGIGIFGGDDDEGGSGPGAPALHGFGGALFYFTPSSLLSPYVGADYWLQLSRRAEGDAGVLFGIGGVHAVVSSRASAFLEAGFGAGLARGGEGERLTRIAGRVGIRIGL